MATTSSPVRAGAKSPEAFSVTITPGSSGLDLSASTISAVAFEVTKPGGEVVTWTAAIDSQAPGQIVCHYTFASAGTDVPKTDIGTRYLVTPLLTMVAGGTRRADLIELPVKR